MDFGMDTTGIEFKRKAYDAILEWKNHLAGKTALLVEGARRVGKTHLVRRFVEREYDSHIFIDFSEKGSRTRAFRRAFEECADTADLLERLQIAAEVSLIPGRSCIVFDEVQRFPSAREAIKQLVAYGKYHYIETGSLLGIAENVKDIVIPSEEHCVKLHPLDFEEFLWATGNPKLAEVIRDRHLSMRPLGRDMHAKAKTIARQYMVVGGMPQSLAAYLTGDDHRLEASDALER